MSDSSSIFFPVPPFFFKFVKGIYEGKAGTYIYIDKSEILAKNTQAVDLQWFSGFKVIKFFLSDD